MQKTKTLKGIGKAVEAIAILSAAGLIVYDFLVLNTLGIVDAYYAILGLIALLIGFVIEMTSDVLADIEKKVNNQKLNIQNVEVEKVASMSNNVAPVKTEKLPKQEEKLKPSTPINMPKKQQTTTAVKPQQVRAAKPASEPTKKAPTVQTKPLPVNPKPPVKQAQIKPVKPSTQKPIQATNSDPLKSFFTRDERYTDVDAETDRVAKQFVKAQRELSFNQTDLHDEPLPLFEDDMDEVSFNNITQSVYEEPRRQVAQRPIPQPVDAFGGIEAEEDMTAKLRRLSKNKQSTYKTINLN